MKKVCIFLMLISFLKPALGQNQKPITKGNFLAGGSMSFYTQTSKQTVYVGSQRQEILVTNKDDVFQPDIKIGYFPLNNFTIGLLANAETYANKSTDDQSDEIHRYRLSNYGIGPFVRYSTDFGLFIQGSASIGFIKQLERKWKSQLYSFGVGYNFYIKSVLSIEPSLSYKYTFVPSHGLTEDLKSKGLFFTIGSSIYFDLGKTN